MSHKCYSHPKETTFRKTPDAPESDLYHKKIEKFHLFLCCSVELDFKQQEDKLQPLMKRLCPMDSQQCPALPYPNEVFTSTPKRKTKTESKKHARWKLWFL